MPDVMCLDLNFSHGSIETHRKNLDSIRSLEKKYNHATCILADLQGPKLRVGEFHKTEESLKKRSKIYFRFKNRTRK